MMRGWGWNYGYGAFGLLGWLPTVIFWLALIFLVVALFRHIGGNEKSVDHEKDKTPVDILKERYAKGEINKKQFDEMKKDLT